MTTLYLVRHGETDWNVARRIQGSTDIPLNNNGRAQAARTGLLLARRRFDEVISSPLSRAFETASIIAGEVGLPEPTPDPAMVERRYGAAEGLDYRTLDRMFPRGASVPGRESREAVVERVFPALIDLAHRRPGQQLVVVTHGGVIRAVVNAIEPGVAAFGVPITNGSIHSFRYTDGDLSLIAFDDPIDHESIDPGAEDFVDQNAIAAREAALGD